MATALQNTGPAQYVNPVTGYPKPPQGLIVSGHVLVDFTGQRAASEGTYAYGVGIFSASGQGEWHKYVVWTLILFPESEGRTSVWGAESGDYCQTLTEAIEAYERRGGKA